MGYVIGGGGAGDLTSGTLADARLSSNVTLQTNTFNSANKLVKLDGNGKLPILDGSNLTNLPSGSSNIVLITEQTVTGSAVANLNFTSLDFTGYYKIEIVSSKVKTTNGVNVIFGMQINGITTGVYNIFGANFQTYATIGVAWAGTTDYDTCEVFTILPNPSSTTERKSWYSLGMNFTSTMVEYRHGGTLANALATRNDAITSLKFFAVTGNLDVGTNIKIIGHKY